MTVALNGESLTIDKLVDVARNKHQVEVSKRAWQRIESCRKMLEKKIKERHASVPVSHPIPPKNEA